MVRFIRAEDRQGIDTPAGIARVFHVDAVGRGAGELDADRVRVLAAVDIERVGSAAGLAGERGQAVDVDRIRPILAQHRGIAGKFADGEIERVVARAELDRCRRRADPAAQGELVVATEAGQRQHRGGDGGAQQRQRVVARAEIDDDLGALDRRGLDDGAGDARRIDDGIDAGGRGQREVTRSRLMAAGEFDVVVAAAERERDRGRRERDGVRDDQPRHAVVGQDVAAGPARQGEAVPDRVPADERGRVGAVAELDREEARFEIGLLDRAVHDAQVAQRIGAARRRDRDIVGDPVRAGQGQRVGAGADIDAQRFCRVASLEVDDVVARAGRDRDRARLQVVAAREPQGVAAAAQIDRERAGRDVGPAGDAADHAEIPQDIVAGPAADREGVRAPVGAGQSDVVLAVTRVDLHRAGGIAPLEVDDVAARAGADRERAGHHVGARRSQAVVAAGEIDRQRVERVAATERHGVLARTAGDAHRTRGYGDRIRECDRVVAVPGEQTDGAAARERALRDPVERDHLVGIVRVAPADGDGALTGHERAVEEVGAAQAAALDRDRAADEETEQSEDGSGLVGRHDRIVAVSVLHHLEVGLQDDVALGLHHRARLDSEVVAGGEGDGALGREDRDAGADQQEVVAPGRILAREHVDGLLRDQVGDDRDGARRAHVDRAAGLDAGLGPRGDAAHAQAADVPQPDIIAGRGFDAAIGVAGRSLQLGDDALRRRADAARGDQLGLAGDEVRAAAVAVVVIGRSIEDAARRGRQDGDAVIGGRDAGEMDVAIGLDDDDVAACGRKRDPAGRGAADIAVELEGVGAGADAVARREDDGPAADIGPSAAGQIGRRVDVARARQVAAVEDRGLRAQDHVARRGDRHHPQVGRRLRQSDGPRGARPDGPGELHLKGVGAHMGCAGVGTGLADRPRRLQREVAGRDLGVVVPDAVEDAAPVGGEEDVLAREGGFQLQVARAGGDVDVLRAADREGSRQLDADRLLSAADGTPAAFEDGVTATDIRVGGAAAVDEAVVTLEADLLAIRGGDQAHRRRGRRGDEDLTARADVERSRGLQHHRLALLDQEPGDEVERIPGILGRLEHDETAAGLGGRRELVRVEIARVEDEGCFARLRDLVIGRGSGRVGGRHAECAGKADPHSLLEPIRQEAGVPVGQGAVDDGNAAGCPRRPHTDLDVGREPAVQAARRVEELAGLEADHPARDRSDPEHVGGDGSSVRGVPGDEERVADGVERGVPGAARERQHALVRRSVVAEAQLDAGRGGLEPIDGHRRRSTRRLAAHRDAGAEGDVAGASFLEGLAAGEGDGDHRVRDGHNLEVGPGFGGCVLRQTADEQRGIDDVSVLDERGEVPGLATHPGDGSGRAIVGEDDVGGGRLTREEHEVAALGGSQIDLLFGRLRRRVRADLDQCGVAGRADTAGRDELDRAALNDRALDVDDGAGHLLQQALADRAQQFLFRPALDAVVDALGGRPIDEEGRVVLLLGRQSVLAVGSRQAVEEGVERPVLRRERRSARILGRLEGGGDGRRHLGPGFGRSLCAGRTRRIDQRLTREARREGCVVDARIDLLVAVAPIGVVAGLVLVGPCFHPRCIVGVAEAAEIGVKPRVLRLERGFGRHDFLGGFRLQEHLAQRLELGLVGELHRQCDPLGAGDPHDAARVGTRLVAAVDLVRRAELRQVTVTEAGIDRIQLRVFGRAVVERRLDLARDVAVLGRAAQRRAGGIGAERARQIGDLGIRQLEHAVHQRAAQLPIQIVLCREAVLSTLDDAGEAAEGRRKVAVVDRPGRLDLLDLIDDVGGERGAPEDRVQPGEVGRRGAGEDRVQFRVLGPARVERRLDLGRDIAVLRRAAQHRAGGVGAERTGQVGDFGARQCRHTVHQRAAQLQVEVVLGGEGALVTLGNA
ncbi:hypothetical protein GCM10008965_16560 [Methylorubrum aminovorans]